MLFYTHLADIESSEAKNGKKLDEGIPGPFAEADIMRGVAVSWANRARKSISSRVGSLKGQLCLTESIRT